jgi:hypothetical protein
MRPARAGRPSQQPVGSDSDRKKQRAVVFRRKRRGPDLQTAVEKNGVHVKRAGLRSEVGCQLDSAERLQFASPELADAMKCRSEIHAAAFVRDVEVSRCDFLRTALAQSLQRRPGGRCNIRDPGASGDVNRPGVAFRCRLRQAVD